MELGLVKIFYLVALLLFFATMQLSRKDFYGGCDFSKHNFYRNLRILSGSDE